MPALPTNRTTADTAADHVADHNTVHGLNNQLGSFTQSTSAPSSPATGDLWLDTDAVTNVPSCRVYNSAALSLVNATETTLTFNSERFDTDTMHSTASLTERITFTTAGLYVVTAALAFAANVTGIRFMALRLNGATPLAALAVPAVGTGDHHQTVTTVYKFAATDYVEVRAYQNSGGALNVNAGGNYTPEFAAVRVGDG